MTPIEATAIALSLEARIAVLWRQHQRDKGLPYWTPARHDRDMELRALLRVARSGRRLARGVLEREDAVTASKAYRDLGYHEAQAVGPVTEPELFEGYGVEPEAASDALNREGDPAWNGAFSRW